MFLLLYKGKAGTDWARPRRGLRTLQSPRLQPRPPSLAWEQAPGTLPPSSALKLQTPALSPEDPLASSFLAEGNSLLSFLLPSCP